MSNQTSGPCAGDIWSLVPTDPRQPAPLVLLLSSTDHDHWRGYPCLEAAILACNRDGQVIPGDDPMAGDPEGCWCVLDHQESAIIHRSVLGKRWVTLDPGTLAEAIAFSDGKPSQLPRGIPLFPELDDPRIGPRERELAWYKLCAAQDRPPTSISTGHTMSLNEQIQAIITKRQALLPEIEREESRWNAAEQFLNHLRQAAAELGNARNATPELRDLSRQVDDLVSIPIKAKAALTRIRERCRRTTINIGVGGAARMGKSTLLQSITGLGETQIPTSDKFFCTAIRSQIVNSSNGYAEAIFHDEQSLLRDYLIPAMEAAGVKAIPGSLDAFWGTNLNVQEHQPTIEQQDVLHRLKDAQTLLPSFRHELRGDRRRIELGQLKPYVSYPDTKHKAGPFLAVRELTIYAPFPSTAVANIQVMDLPGLGEAGVNLAALHTKGMEDLCDLTMLVKRPTENNLAWTSNDSAALSAMEKALGSIRDQSHYTIMLVNTGGIPSDRAKECMESVQNVYDKRFTAIECNAKSKEMVAKETMPSLLAHLAKYLPGMDKQIYESAKGITVGLAQQWTQAIDRMAGYLQKNAPQSPNSMMELHKRTTKLREVLAKALHDLTEEWRRKGEDKDWQEAIQKTHKEVTKWIQDGCGYGSPKNLIEAIASDIRQLNGQPSHVVNAVRVGLNDSWDSIDIHLGQRIASALQRIIELLRKETGSFVPDDHPTDLAGVRALINRIADRFDSEAVLTDDRQCCPGFAACLRRLAALDISYRFHLMPLLISNTRILSPNDVFEINDPAKAELFAADLIKKASQSADKISQALRDADDHGFEPNRVILAVNELFYDAFIRSKDSHDEFPAWTLSWRDEIWPKVFTSQEADSALVKQFRAALQGAKASLVAPGT